jgi:hypothetical protein
MCSSYSFTTSALDGGVVSVTPRLRLTPEERTPGIYCTGGWVGPGAGLDILNLDRPAVQSLARHYSD